MSKNEIINFMHKEQAYIETAPRDIIQFKYAKSLQIQHRYNFYRRCFSWKRNIIPIQKITNKKLPALLLHGIVIPTAGKFVIRPAKAKDVLTKMPRSSVRILKKCCINHTSKQEQNTSQPAQPLALRGVLIYSTVKDRIIELFFLGLYCYSF